MQAYRDCQVTQTQTGFIIANNRIEKQISFYGAVPVIESFKDTQTGYCYQTEGKPCPAFKLPILDFNKASVNSRVFTDDNLGLSETSLILEMVFSQGEITVRWQNVIYPKMPFVASRLSILTTKSTTASVTDSRVISEGNENATINAVKEDTEFEKIPDDTIEAFRFNSRHTKLKTVLLNDVSDHHNNFVEEQETIPYIMWEQSFSGHFFFFDDYVGGNGLLVVKEAPCEAGKFCANGEDLRTWMARYVMVTGSGVDYTNIPCGEEIALYSCVVGVGKPDCLREAYKDYYRAEFGGLKSRGLYTMSNTWGDRSQDKAVCESFMLKEISAAAQMGIDCVQIDDGWMKGRTANSALVQTDLWVSGYYENNPDFWQVDTVKFPNGLEPICNAIEVNGLQLGLWFSPDLANDYAQWQKDVDTLIGLHQQYNVHFIKLDGIKLTGKLSESRLLRMMREVIERTSGKVWFNMDITAQIRLGHLYQKQYGSLFVENRYTDSTNYYPHWTLKNIWELSKYIPVGKCQFELLNKNRNDDRYLANYENDPFRPSLYPADTLFAITMLSCPLIWMEMSNLPQGDLETIAKLVEVWKQHREALSSANVCPIGALPDGLAYTGFVAETDEKSGYLLLFREFSEEQKHTFPLRLDGAALEILYANCKASLAVEDGDIVASIKHKGCFVFARYER